MGGDNYAAFSHHYRNTPAGFAPAAFDRVAHLDLDRAALRPQLMNGKPLARWKLTVPGFAIRLIRIMGLALTLLFLPEIIMAQECPVSAPLILKETQAGVVGETGTVWTIAPDCSFTIARQIGSKLFDPHKRGHLTAEQQARLKEMLDQMGEPHIASLPAGPPHVNPHRITLSYGERQAELTLPAGDLDSARLRALMGNDRARSMLDLAAAMKDMLGH